jgi:hypothetical protein
MMLIPKNRIPIYLWPMKFGYIKFICILHMVLKEPNIRIPGIRFTVLLISLHTIITMLRVCNAYLRILPRLFYTDETHLSHYDKNTGANTNHWTTTNRVRFLL